MPLPNSDEQLKLIEDATQSLAGLPNLMGGVPSVCRSWRTFIRVCSPSSTKSAKYWHSDRARPTQSA
ncbi:MAG: hypothetical protein ACXQS4_03180 [Methermicoccaceae archaeon]